MQNEIVKYAFRGQTEGIEVKPLDFLRKSRTLTERIHRTDFYQLLYVTDGELHLTIDFESIVLQMGACVVIAPGQVCSFDSSGAYDGWAVLFTAEFFAETPFDTSFLHGSPLFTSWGEPVIFFPDKTFSEEILTLFHAEMQKSQDHLQYIIARNYLRIFLLEADRRISSSHCNSHEVLQRFCREVETNHAHLYSVSDYLNRLGIHEKTLSAAVKQAFGITPKTYIDRRRVLEAKRLLAHSTLSVKEVAYALGFDEATNFTKFFFRHTHLLPLAFRKQVNRP